MANFDVRLAPSVLEVRTDFGGGEAFRARLGGLAAVVGGVEDGLDPEVPVSVVGGWEGDDGPSGAVGWEKWRVGAKLILLILGLVLDANEGPLSLDPGSVDLHRLVSRNEDGTVCALGLNVEFFHDPAQEFGGGNSGRAE